MKKLTLLAGLFVVFSGIQTASAAIFSGTFADDSNVQFFSFDLSGESHLLVNSSSFASGGFWPSVALWVPDGNGGLTSAGGGACGGSCYPFDAPDDLAWDINLNSVGGFIPGTYFLALFETKMLFASNTDFAGSTPDTSVFTGLAGFTASTYGCLVPGDFYIQNDQGDCVQRTGSWMLDIQGSNSNISNIQPYPFVSAVPEPATLALALAGLAGFAPFARPSGLSLLIPKLLLGNAGREALASRAMKLELLTLSSQAGAWELAKIGN